MPKIVVLKVQQRREDVLKAKTILGEVDQEVVVKQKRNDLKMKSPRNVLEVVMVKKREADQLAGKSRKKVDRVAMIKQVRKVDLEVETKTEVLVTAPLLGIVLRKH